jgi:hypothetical protein
MLRWYSAHPSYILNGQEVYMLCLDGLVQYQMGLHKTIEAWYVDILAI